MTSELMSGFEAMFSAVEHLLAANLWWAIPGVLIAALIAAPMPFRGPVSTARDQWRGFKYAPRAEVMARAGGRCEAAAFIVWGRCPSAATEVDHIYAWSRGGPTVASNGQALCRSHNRAKGAVLVPWWYLASLERRRRTYFPIGADVTVRAALSASDRAARDAWRARQAPAPRSRAGRR